MTVPEHDDRAPERDTSAPRQEVGRAEVDEVPVDEVPVDEVPVDEVPVEPELDLAQRADAELGSLEELPLSEHPQVYARIHEALQRELTDIAGA